MKVIMEVITRGVTALPLKRNLISRFVKGGEKHKKRWTHRLWRKEDIKTFRRMRASWSVM
jgi:hypothetical protein